VSLFQTTGQNIFLLLPNPEIHFLSTHTREKSVNQNTLLLLYIRDLLQLTGDSAN